MDELRREQMSDKSEFLLFDILQELKSISAMLKRLDQPTAINLVQAEPLVVKAKEPEIEFKEPEKVLPSKEPKKKKPVKRKPKVTKKSVKK
jgi:hypothetical protein